MAEGGTAAARCTPGFRLDLNVLPGSEPDRAYDLVRPLAALRNAVTYHRFLEVCSSPRSGRTNESDVPHWLCVAAETER